MSRKIPIELNTTKAFGVNRVKFENSDHYVSPAV